MTGHPSISITRRLGARTGESRMTSPSTSSTNSESGPTDKRSRTSFGMTTRPARSMDTIMDGIVPLDEYGRGRASIWSLAAAVFTTGLTAQPGTDPTLAGRYIESFVANQLHPDVDAAEASMAHLRARGGEHENRHHHRHRRSTGRDRRQVRCSTNPQRRQTPHVAPTRTLRPPRRNNRPASRRSHIRTHQRRLGSPHQHTLGAMTSPTATAGCDHIRRIANPD